MTVPPSRKSFFDFAQNHRHCIGRKADPTPLIKAVGRLDQPHTTRPIEIIVFNAPAPEASGTGVYQPEVLFNECTAPGLVRYHGIPSFPFM